MTPHSLWGLKDGLWESCGHVDHCNLLKTLALQYSRSEVMLTFFERSPLDQVLRNDKVHRIQPCFQSPIKISGLCVVLCCNTTVDVIITPLMSWWFNRWCNLALCTFQKSCGLMDSVWPIQKPSYLITVSLKKRRDLHPLTQWNIRKY